MTTPIVSAAHVLRLASRRTLGALTERNRRLANFYRAMAENIGGHKISDFDPHFPRTVREALSMIPDSPRRTDVDILMREIAWQPDPNSAVLRRGTVASVTSGFGREVDRCIQASPTLSELYRQFVQSGVPLHVDNWFESAYTPEFWLGFHHTQWGHAEWGVTLPPPRRGAPGNFAEYLAHELTHAAQEVECTALNSLTHWDRSSIPSLCDVLGAQEVDAFIIAASVRKEILDELGPAVFQPDFLDPMNQKILGVLHNVEIGNHVDLLDMMKSVTPFNEHYLPVVSRKLEDMLVSGPSRSG